MTFEFLIVTSRDGKTPTVEPLDRAKARSQVMKAYKRQQREKLALKTAENTADNPRPTPKVKPAADEAWRAHRNSKKPKSRSRKPASLENDLRKVFLHRTQVGESAYARIATLSDQNDCQHAVMYVSVDPANAYRASLVAAIAMDSFPTDTPPSSSASAILAHLASPHSLALQAGNDALALMCLASATGNYAFVHESRRCYLAATMCLRQEMASSDFNFHSVMGTAQMILAWNAHGGHAEEGIGWREHVDGLTAIMEARPRHMHTTCGLHCFILEHYRHPVLMKSFVERKRLPLKPASLHDGKETVQKGGYEALIRLALELPDCLERARARRWDEEGTDESADESLHDRLATLQDSLEAWCDDFQDRRKGSNVLELIEDPEIQAPNSAKLAYSSFLDALYHSFYWTCHLLLTQALLDVAEANNSSTFEQEALKGQANTYAMLLVRLIPFLWNSAGGQSGKALAVRGVFHFVEEWYERIGDERRLEICRAKERECRKQGKYRQWDLVLAWAYSAMCWLQ